MRQIKLGPIIRNEPDKRIYGDIFHRRSLDNWRHRLFVLWRTKVAEGEYRCSERDRVILYRDLGDYFHDLEGYDAHIHCWLKRRARRKGYIADRFDIAVHLRTGDFKLPAEGHIGMNRRIPLDWYDTAIETARREIGSENVSVVLFTDAPKDEATALCRRWGATLDPAKNAITSIFNIGRSQMVVTSRSSFSMWGVFLGRCGAIWEASFTLAKYWPQRPGLDIRL